MVVARFVAPDDVKANMQTIGAIEATFSPLPTGFSSPCSWRSGDAFGCVYECWISRVFANGFGVSLGLVDGLKVLCYVFVHCNLRPTGHAMQLCSSGERQKNPAFICSLR